MPEQIVKISMRQNIEIVEWRQREGEGEESSN